MKHDFYEGKYTVEFNESTGKLTALRHGHPWRDVQGDGLILGMLQEVDELKTKPNCAQVLDLIAEWGGIDGGHHKGSSRTAMHWRQLREVGH